MAKPIAPKAPSKLLTKLKQIKKVIRSNPLAKKESNAVGHSSKKGPQNSTPFNKTLADLIPTASTALDYEYRRASPFHHPQNLGPITPSIKDLPKTTTPTATLFLAPPPNFPPNASSTPLAPAHHVLPRHRQPAPISHVKAEVLGARSPLAELATFERDSRRDGTQEVKVKLSKQPQRVVMHTAPVIKSYSAEIYPCQPAKVQLMPASNVLPKIKIAGAEERTNRLDPSRGLRQTRQHCNKSAMDFNERLAQYRNGGVQKYLQPVGKSNDGGSSLQDYATHAAHGTFREPPERVDQNAGSDETCQAGADEESEDANSSYQHANQPPAPEPSLWLGQRLF